MSSIKTAAGWKQLTPECHNYVVEIVSWNHHDKRCEKDPNGTLQKIGEVRFAEPSYREFNEKAYWARHDAWIKRVRSEIDASQERRAGY